jgi:glutamate 5-kinase
LRELLSRARRVVVKIGSRLIGEDPAGRPAALAAEIAALRARGVAFVVVSSGAIALGRKVLGLGERPRELPRLQAAAAVGQGRLMQAWEAAFAAHGIPVAQILLTHDDVGDRGRFLAARHALFALVDEFAAVPIINENDTVATEEIKFGDNDGLAALVVNLVAADALIVLTDVNGLHDADPRAGGRRIPLVTDIDAQAAPVAGGSSSGVGLGGMASSNRRRSPARAACRRWSPRGARPTSCVGCSPETISAPCSCRPTIGWRAANTGSPSRCGRPARSCRRGSGRSPGASPRAIR